MPESLLNVTKIILFGQTVYDVEIKTPKKKDESGRGLPRYFPSDARFARIYGFSYDGQYYDMARPTLFVVDGPGEELTEGQSSIAPSHPSRAPRAPEYTGVAVADFQFSDEIRYWTYDQYDYTVRLDVESGMFEDLLLAAEFASQDAAAQMAGAQARVSGAQARVSGAQARVSGAQARVSGAQARVGRNRGGSD